MDLVYKRSKSVNFPHLAKNARYGAPEFVEGKNPKVLFTHPPKAAPSERVSLSEVC
jgi:hypothetical protein